MGFSAISPASIAAACMGEITLANGQGTTEVEGLCLPQEFIDSEMLKELDQQGLLRGETKQYTFILQEGSSLPQSLNDYLSDLNRPQIQKGADLKSSVNSPSLKESSLTKKECKLFEPHKQSSDVGPKELKEIKTSIKTERTAHQKLEKALLPTSLSQLKQTPALKHQQGQAKSLEQRVQKELLQKTEREGNTNRKTVESRRHSQESEQGKVHLSMPRADKNEEREQQQKRQKHEEEGFAEKERDQREEFTDEDENKQNKVEKIESPFARELTSYAAEESILSQIFNLRVSQFDVLILFIEIMKLEIRGREQERIARRHERELQLLHLQNMVDNYKQQGRWTFMSSLGSGILSIISGLAPVVGHIGGDFIVQKLSGISFFKNLRDWDKDKLFKQIEKVTSSLADMYKSTGHIHNTFAEGNRTLDQHMSDLHKTDWEENTRTMDEIKDSWKGIENFLYQTLQMYHDAIRQLYS